MNIQGDEPDIDISDIRNLNTKMINHGQKLELQLLKLKIIKCMKMKMQLKLESKKLLIKTLFHQQKIFFRKTKDQEKNNIYHHIGVYCYKVQSLKKFISFKQSKNELDNRLEQLRALDNNIDINVALANRSPIGVDTKEDYIDIKKIMKYK